MELAATVAGLKGSQNLNLVITSDSFTGGTLTVGGNNESTTSAGRFAVRRTLQIRAS